MRLRRILQLFLVTTVIVAAAALQAPRESCRDHYLHGQSETKVLPLSQSGSSIYNVECIVPAPYSDNVIMNVRNGLEKWHTLKGNKQTVDYQISDRDYLRTLMAGAFCQQKIFIKWSVPGDKTIVSDSLTVVSLNGVERTLAVNFTMNDLSHEYSLNDADSAILHVIPSEYSLPHSIRLSPLTCRQKIITNSSCEFELNKRNHFVGINNKNYKEVSFAFRTDVHSTPLVELDSGNGSFKLELSQGYLIKGDGFPAPIGLLADGNWHTMRIDLVSRLIFIDEPNSLVIGNQWKSSKIRMIRVLVSGRVTAFKLNGKPDWVCGKPLEHQTKPEILHQICPPGKSSCNCKAPHDAVQHICPPTPIDTYTLMAAPSFFFKEHMKMLSFSVSIKSVADAGLVAYGQKIGTDGRVDRFQVQFDGEVLTAFSCLLDSTMCRSCHIIRPGGFRTDEWIRISLFPDAQHIFVTADKQICQLKINGTQYGFVDLYNGPQNHPRSFIFIGGALDENAYGFRSRMNNNFTQQFFDKTTAKAPSLKGCVGDLFIDGVPESLVSLHDQLAKDKFHNPFLRMEAGCNSCPSSRCSARCLGYSKQNDPICDCSSSFMAKLPTTGQCIVERKAMEPTALSFSFAEPMILRDRLLGDPPHYQAPVKIWALLRFPASSDNDQLAFAVSGLRIIVGNYGRRVIIDASQIGLKEEFYVENYDERLHLLSVDWKRTMYGNNITITVRIDHDIRKVYLSRHPFVSPTEVIVSVFNNSANPDAFTGCLSEFTIDYEMINYEIDSVDVLSRLFSKVDPYLAASNSTPLLYDDQCGIRDPLLWAEPTSSFGRFREYDPIGNTNALHSADMRIVTFIVVSILILILLCVLIIYCCRQTHTRTYHTAERERLVQKSETSTSSPGHSASPASLQPATPKRTIITQTESATPRSIIVQNLRDGKKTNAPMASQEV